MRRKGWRNLAFSSFLQKYKKGIYISNIWVYDKGENRNRRRWPTGETGRKDNAMFDSINIEALCKSCDVLYRRCSELPIGERHGSAWLFDKVMRVFDDPAAVSVTIPVYINCVGAGEATISRDGSLVMRASH